MDYSYRRACAAGEYLVLPGGKDGGNAPLDIISVSAANPREWSHVRRYTIQDIYGTPTPVLLVGRSCLFTRSPHPLHLHIRVSQ